MLRDDGPPVSLETIHEARRSLPLEYGYRIVTERGRKVLLVRSPRAKPDYLHELAEVALYVSLDEVKDLKDVLLIGGEKTCRLEPRILKDHIKEQLDEDARVADELRRRLQRDYGATAMQSPRHREHKAFALRLPRRSVADITADDVLVARDVLREYLDGRARDCQMGYIVADEDFERLGRRVLVELLDPEAAAAMAPPAEPEAEAAPAPGPADALKAAALASVATSAPAPIVEPSHVAYSAPAPAHAPAHVDADAAEPELAARAMETLAADDNCEVYVRKAPSATPAAPAKAVRTAPPPPAPAAPPPPPVPAMVAHEPVDSESAVYSDGPVPSRLAARVEETEEYEVFVSKPKTATPPPVHVPRPAAAPPQHPKAPPAVAQPAGPSDDNGHSMEPSVVARVDEVAALRSRFEDAGYEVMSDVQVMGNSFEFAAHRIEGKRVLVKRVPTVDAKLQASLAQLTVDLGADACIVISESVAPGARLAAWGSRVAILSPDEAARLPL